jgi:hypothetical protein
MFECGHNENAVELIPFASFDVSPTGVFGAFSGALLLSAALSQWAGKVVDDRDATYKGVTDCFRSTPPGCANTGHPQTA